MAPLPAVCVLCSGFTNVSRNTRVGTEDLNKFHWFEMLNLAGATDNFSNPW